MQAPPARMTRKAYVRDSRHWSVKHEWVNGECYAMSGGSFRHNAIATNILRALSNQLAGSECRLESSRHDKQQASTQHPERSRRCLKCQGTLWNRMSLLPHLLLPPT